MKRFICVVFVLLFATFAAACTTEDDNGGTTTSSDVNNVSTTTTKPSDVSDSQTSTTTLPSQQSGEATTHNHDVTSVTSTISTTNTTSVQNSTGSDFPYSVATYAEYPYVPDYGAMLGITPAVKKEGGYSYRMDTVVMADPEGKSGTDYMNLLKNCGYMPIGSKEESGLSGVVFAHPEYKTAVFFAASPEKGYILILISTQ